MFDMIVTADQKPEYFDFASKVLGVPYRYEDGCKVLTNLHDDGRIAAVVVYSRMSKINCELSVATDMSRRWMSRLFLFQVFAYPFLQLNLRRVTGVVEDGNENALRLNAHLGYVLEGRLRNWFGDNDGIVMSILRDECKWLKLFDRKKNHV